jgi:hypothetical protein
MSTTARSTRRRLTDEQRAERRQADREYARQAVERLRSSEGWQAWLASRRHFHAYSLGNQILIAMARPSATRVAGFKRWLSLGYCVERGQTAIRIWAPCPPSKKAIERWEQSGADPARRPRTFYKLAPVFAQDQVAPLPAPAEPVPLEPPIHPVEGDELAGVLPRLYALATELGCTVVEEEMAGHQHGYLNPESWRIGIDTRLSPNGQVKTCCHELAHALIRLERDDDDPELERASEELVVESVAFTATGALGVCCEGYSIPYLASWAESAELEVLERMAGLINRLASRIEDAALGEGQETGR